MYDLAIIGGGWAGFNACLQAKKLGLTVCLIEKSLIGGTCLNLGCIPTKALIRSAKILTLAKKSVNFGLKPLSPEIDFIRVQERKDNIVKTLRQGMQSSLKGIDCINEQAQIISAQEIKAGAQVIKTKHILIATGSKSVELPFLKFNGNKVLSSDDILGLRELPGSLLIVGGGVIGCEFASLFSTLGTRVTVVEKMPQLLPGEDAEVAKRIETVFKKKGIKVSTSTDASTLDIKEYDRVLVAVGRAPRTEGLDMEKLGIKIDKGRVVVDECLRTSVPGIFAAGDCTGKKMLAHFAAYQGELAAENIASPGFLKKAQDEIVPNCIFTDPEIASVGISEEQAKAKGIAVKVSKFDFLASGMARILDETEGFIKVVSDEKTEQVLGASIIGPQATELIAALALAVANRLKTSDIRNTIFAHPTLSESIHEALK
jgi:dihydrolipoamide dehydrogenase